MDWLVLAILPPASKIAEGAGFTVNISKPSVVPDKLIPNLNVWLSLDGWEILLGVVDDNPAEPPLIENTKSPTSRSPVPPDEL